MGEEVTIDREHSCILVRSWGVPSLAEMDATLSRIAQLRAESGIDSVLVDSRARTAQPSLAEMMAGGRMVGERLGPSARIAVLVERLEDGQVYFRITAAG